MVERELVSERAARELERREPQGSLKGESAKQTERQRGTERGEREEAHERGGRPSGRGLKERLRHTRLRNTRKLQHNKAALTAYEFQ